MQEKEKIMKMKKMPDPHKPLNAKEWRELGTAMHGIVGLPEEAQKAIVRLRGRPIKQDKKIALSLRLDKKVVDKLRAKGRGWQTNINNFLLNAVNQGLI